jgi:hypothetical protein
MVCGVIFKSAFSRSFMAYFANSALLFRCCAKPCVLNRARKIVAKTTERVKCFSFGRTFEQIQSLRIGTKSVSALVLADYLGSVLPGLADLPVKHVPELLPLPGRLDPN